MVLVYTVLWCNLQQNTSQLEKCISFYFLSAIALTCKILLKSYIAHVSTKQGTQSTEYIQLSERYVIAVMKFETHLVAPYKGLHLWPIWTWEERNKIQLYTASFILLYLWTTSSLHSKESSIKFHASPHWTQVRTLLGWQVFFFSCAMHLELSTT